MSNSPQTEFEELFSQMNSEPRSNDLWFPNDPMGTTTIESVHMDMRSWSTPELVVDLVLESSNQPDRFRMRTIARDGMILDTDLPDGTHVHNSGPGTSNFTFDDWIPEWLSSESDQRPSSSASILFSQEESFFPIYSSPSEVNSDVGSPLEPITYGFSQNSTYDPNRNAATTPSSLSSSAFSSPPVQNASLHPSPAISHASLPPAFICRECGNSYKTKNNLQRHRRDALHGQASPSSLLATYPHIADSEHPSPLIPLVSDKKMFDCPHPECSRKGENGFPRKDNMVQHQRLVHNTPIAKRNRRKADQKGRVTKR